MSASREKKKRQEFLASGAVDPKAVRAAEQAAADKKSKTMYTLLAVIFVVVAIALVVYNSGVLQRNKTAVTLDGTEYTVGEMSYYYGNVYQNLLSQYGNYVGLIGLDTSKSLKDQPAWGSGEQSWDEYFKEQSVDTLTFVHAALAKANEAGMTLSETELASYENTIAAVKENASANGYTYKSYLAAMFGSYVTPEIYETQLKNTMLADKYAQSVYDGITYTDDEIQAYYEENKNSYDLVDAEYISLNATVAATTDDEGNTIEPTEEEQKAANEAAAGRMEELLEMAQGGVDLADLAEPEDLSYITNDEMGYSSTVYGEWLFADERKVGDMEVLVNEDTNMYYLVAFHGRFQDETPSTYSVRHILIDETSQELAENEEVTDELIHAAAELVLSGWDGTEEGFAALAEQHSTDAGSKTNGGLYEDVAQGTMVTEFEDWCYAEGRKVGDTGLVDSDYGTHIMYFVGYGDEASWHANCKAAMVSDAYEAWQTELLEGVTAETQSGMNSVGR